MTDNKTLTAASKEATIQTTTASMGVSTYQQVKQWLTKGSTFDAFMGVCGEEYGRRFMQSVLTVMKTPRYAALNKCAPDTIVQSAMVAAYTGLSIDPNLGQSALIPYGGQCTFQIMKRGLEQLALRSGVVKTFNTAKVFEGDIASFNPFTGEYVYNQEPHERNVGVGFISYIKLLSGFEKFVYMTNDECRAHGQRYSKSFRTGLWSTDFDVMASKTVAKRLLIDNSILDPSAQAGNMIATALKFDMGTPKSLDLNDGADYPDGQSYEEFVEEMYGKRAEEVKDDSGHE